ncbi:CRISPR-associated endonuclease Cas1 [Pyrobaculum ferrireducens]|uniref:CRISPR-associated endonuclease Cas1 n=1 Tax=Pyrobaculum ferrireducens TaxID=1104324 RepID=G7VBG7_9CREN|nr:CRISPR-associated endonuclease Cas1 [Pyrobaculum ferrireducens]AET32397.1 CRISPR-associated protein Cas1 [Pyrobaculum ferrireducens]
MQIAVASYGTRIRARRGLLVVESPGARREYPLHEVDEVLLLTGGISISTKALRALLRAGATVAVFDQRGEPIGIFMKPVGDATGAKRLCQYKATADGRGLEFARRWIWRKIRGQLENVRTWRRRLARYSQYAEQISKAADAAARAPDARALMEAEAAAAEAYWAAYREVTGFPGRDQDGRDPVNAGLNYGYGILKTLCFKSLLLSGLDPYVGFLHADKSGRPSLVLDFMEQWRPRVDAAVAKSAEELEVEDGLLTHKSRLAVAAAVLEELGAGRSPVSAEIHREARHLAKSLCTS